MFFTHDLGDGFALEGVMRSATPLGEQRFDTNVYGLVVASAAGIS